MQIEVVVMSYTEILCACHMRQSKEVIAGYSNSVICALENYDSWVRERNSGIRKRV